MSGRVPNLGPVEQIRQAAEAANRGDRDAAMRFVAPDAVWDTSRTGVGKFEGAAAIRCHWEDWRRSYEAMQYD